MKRLNLFALLLFILFLTTACNNEVKPPENVSQEVWDLARDHMSLLNEKFEKTQPFIENAEFTEAEQEAYDKIYSLDMALFDGFGRDILFFNSENYTDEELELVTDVFMLDMNVIPDVPMPDDYVDSFVTDFGELKEELQLENKEMDQRVENYKELLDNAEKAVTKNIENYMKTIQEEDFAKMYDSVYTEVEKEEFIANTEEFFFMADYKLDDYKVLSVEASDIFPFDYSARVAMRSTTTEGPGSSVLIVPVDWDIKEKKWIIQADEVEEE